MPTVIVIPALRPARPLVDLVRGLAAHEAIETVVVDDGSGPEFAAVFAAVSSLPRTTVLAHATNLGKGAALKTALNHVACSHPPPSVIVSADADGQHVLEDILAVATRAARRPEALVIGVRSFAGEVPRRSRVGNALTRCLVRALIGLRLADTQSGLRAIPPALVPDLLRLRSRRYEFELDMLILCRHRGIEIVEVPIRTVYIERNRGSHFNPLLDSMRIYLLLFRFLLTSLFSTLLDYAVFAAIYWTTASIGWSQIAARGSSCLVNYAAVRAAVFHDRRPHRVTLPRYLLLAFASGLASYGLILFFAETLGLPVLLAKPLAESFLFFANFAIQRDFVFRVSPEELAA